MMFLTLYSVICELPIILNFHNTFYFECTLRPTNHLVSHLHIYHVLFGTLINYGGSQLYNLCRQKCIVENVNLLKSIYVKHNRFILKSGNKLKKIGLGNCAIS